MPHPIILGVDPGGRETGLALVQGDELHAHKIVVGPKVEAGHTVDVGYLTNVGEAAELLVETVLSLDAVAIEAVGAPNPHIRMTNAAGIIATGAVLGYVVAWARERKLLEPDRVMLIDTEGHGSGHLSAYPQELQPIRGQGKGTDQLRHARSAYDVALAARFYLRIATARRT